MGLSFNKKKLTQDLKELVNTLKKNPSPNTGIVSWKTINDYLLKANDIRKHLCYGCGRSYLYDKNNKQYPVTRINTLEEVKAIVEEIRKINAQ